MALNTNQTLGQAMGNPAPAQKMSLDQAKQQMGNVQPSAAGNRMGPTSSPTTMAADGVNKTSTVMIDGKPQQMTTLIGTPGNGGFNNLMAFKPNMSMDSFMKDMGGLKMENLMGRFPPGMTPDDLQNSLMSIAKIPQSNAGIFDKKEDGLQEWSTRVDGSKLYTSPEVLKNPNNREAGYNQLATVGSVISQMGAFSDPEESDKFHAYAASASNPELLGSLTATLTAGDKKGAVNQLMTQLGRPDTDSIFKEGSQSNPKDIATAYAAHSLMDNWDKMNDTQRSLGLSGLALQTYEYKNGETLGDKKLVAPRYPGDPEMSVGSAMGLMNSGINAYSLMKNFEQFDVLQQLTMGKGGASQMGATARQFGALGIGKEGSLIDVDPAALNAAGFRSAVSAGSGGIVGPGDKLPPGFVVVGNAETPGHVVAVPKGLEGTAATTQGAQRVVTLGTGDGVPSAGSGAFKLYAGWGGQKEAKASNGAVGGSALQASIQKAGNENPYLRSSLVAASVTSNVVPGPADRMAAQFRAQQQSNIANAAQKDIGGKQQTQANYDATAGGAGLATKGAVESGAISGETGGQIGLAIAGARILASDGSGKDKAMAATHVAQDYSAGVASGGITTVIQAVDRQFFGGSIDKLRAKAEGSYLKGAKNIGEAVGGGTGGKIATEAAMYAMMGPYGYALMKVVELTGSGKDADQMGRDRIRNIFKESGLVDGDNKVTNADGTLADMGVDGHGGTHEFRDPTKIPEGNDNRTLNAYDVDYTNDLDFSASLATTALARLTIGGKGKAVDQVSGQLANASIGQTYGQDMTEDTFGKMQGNVRSYWNKQGIKSKEDAIALANQAFAEHRLTEMDQDATIQGINIAFDDDGFDSASMLMEGRHNGIAVAHNRDEAAGPNMSVVARPQTGGSAVDPGRYGSTATPKPIAIPTGTTDAENMPTFNILEQPQAELSINYGSYQGAKTSNLWNDSVSKAKMTAMQKVEFKEAGKRSYTN